MSKKITGVPSVTPNLALNDASRNHSDSAVSVAVAVAVPLPTATASASISAPVAKSVSSTVAASTAATKKVASSAAAVATAAASAAASAAKEKAAVAKVKAVAATSQVAAAVKTMDDTLARTNESQPHVTQGRGYVAKVTSDVAVAAAEMVEPLVVAPSKLAVWWRYFVRTLMLFLPIFIGQLAATSMGVVDTVMAGAAGTLELSGVAIGSSIFWPAELFVVGMCLAIHPLVANLVGSGELSLLPRKMQLVTTVCLAFAATVGLVLVALPHAFLYAHDMGLVSGVDRNMLSIGQGYLTAVGLAMPAYAMFNVLRAYWEGLGKTMPTLLFGCLALTLNIPLNYIFIFGHLSMPALGGVGCGVATCITMYITVGCMLLFVQKHKLFAHVRLYRQWYSISRSEMWGFAKYALPLGIAGMVETLCFSLVAMLLSPFGPVVVASHTIAMNVSGLLVIVPTALSAVASIEVGEAMGRHNWREARARTLSIIAFALGFYLVAVVGLIIGRDLIVALYSQDVAVLSLAPMLLLFCAVFLLPDTLQVIFIGVLRGFKDSRSIFIITIIAYWLIGMPLGVSLGYGYISEALHSGSLSGAQGFWFGFICSLSCASILLGSRIVYIFKRRVEIGVKKEEGNLVG